MSVGEIGSFADRWGQPSVEPSKAEAWGARHGDPTRNLVHVLLSASRHLPGCDIITPRRRSHDRRAAYICLKEEAE